MLALVGQHIFWEYFNQLNYLIMSDTNIGKIYSHHRILKIVKEVEDVFNYDKKLYRVIDNSTGKTAMFDTVENLDKQFKRIEPPKKINGLWHVAIQEILERVVLIDAETDNEAIEIAEQMYRDQDVVLTADDFCDKQIFIRNE